MRIFLLLTLSLVNGVLLTPDNVVELNDQNFDELVTNHRDEEGRISAEGSWLVAFATDWSVNYEAVPGLLSALSQQLGPTFRVGLVDGTSAVRLRRRFTVNSFPHFRVFDGNKQWRYHGHNREDSIAEFCETERYNSTWSAIPWYRTETFLTGIQDYKDYYKYQLVRQMQLNPERSVYASFLLFSMTTTFLWVSFALCNYNRDAFGQRIKKEDTEEAKEEEDSDVTNQPQEMKKIR
eukprot:Lankesteria_metandrocarpae@DN4021_c0_g1_i1.p2